jgi:TorA maturation chaperone TorD
MIATSTTIIDTLLARAVVYRVLSLGFQAPTGDRLRDMGAADRFSTVRAALAVLEEDSAGGLVLAGERLAAGATDLDDVTKRFVHLFGHTARGLVTACETEYGPENVFNQPQQLADLAGYYLAFGLEPAMASETRVDHIACELEFMDFLSRKQALWLANGSIEGADAETIEATEDAERGFLRDHLGRFGRAFAARVAAEDPHGYFGALGRLLRAFIDAECARAGVEAGPVDLLVRPDAPDDTPMACGSADGSADEQLIQIQRRPGS